MKKLIIIGMFLLVTFMVLSACISKNGSTSSRSNRSGKVEFKVQYIQNIRTSDPPALTVISSKSELEQYHEETWKFISLFFPATEADLLPITNFSNATKEYSDKFFKDNFLVIVELWEPSGSIRHRVERIDENGNIVISRLLPEIGTTDIGEWGIIIELNNRFKLSQYQLVLVDEKL
jgi:hypothetical protein